MQQQGRHRADWATWTFIWDQAVQRQADRILEADFHDAQFDMMLFADALRNVLRGAEKVLGETHHDVLAFLDAVPDVVAVRDIFEHFDEYVAGIGKLQKKGLMGNRHWIPLHARVEGHSHSVRFGPYSLEVNAGRVASSVLMVAARDAADS
jgi:hypothetical protein